MKSVRFAWVLSLVIFAAATSQAHACGFQGYSTGAGAPDGVPGSGDRDVGVSYYNCGGEIWAESTAEPGWLYYVSQ